MRGMTLMELMVVITIVGLLAGIGVPSYRSYLIRTNRTDATAALLRIAAAQEKFYLQNNRYASTAAELADAPPQGLGIAATERGFYSLEVASNDATVDFVATARPLAGGPQDVDDACTVFTISERGLRTAQNSAAAANTETCWR